MPLLKRFLGLLSLSLLMSHCGIPKGQQADSLTRLDDDSVYRANYSDPETSLDIAYTASEKTDGLIDLDVSVNSKSFAYELSKNDGLKSFSPGVESLSADERRALSSMPIHGRR